MNSLPLLPRELFVFSRCLFWRHQNTEHCGNRSSRRVLGGRAHARFDVIANAMRFILLLRAFEGWTHACPSDYPCILKKISDCDVVRVLLVVLYGDTLKLFFHHELLVIIIVSCPFNP